MPLVFQSFTEWQNSQLGLHPVQASDLWLFHQHPSYPSISIPFLASSMTSPIVFPIMFNCCCCWCCFLFSFFFFVLFSLKEKKKFDEFSRKSHQKRLKDASFSGGAASLFARDRWSHRALDFQRPGRHQRPLHPHAGTELKMHGHERFRATKLVQHVTRNDVH